MKILSFDSVNRHCVRNCVEESSVHGVDEDRSALVSVGRYYCANIELEGVRGVVGEGLFGLVVAWLCV